MRDNHLKLQPTVKTIVLCEKQNIALRSDLRDSTHLNTDNIGNVVLETHLAKQNNNALLTSKIEDDTKRNCCHHSGAEQTEDESQS